MRRSTSIAIEARGSIVVSLLWVLAILAIVVVGALYTVQMDLRVAKNYGDTIQARYLARAGVEKAKALLYQEAINRQQNHSGSLYDAPRHFRDIELGRGQFRVIRQARRNEGSGRVYGVSDEESRLNLNHATAEELERLPGMSAQTAASIVDYRDGDGTVTPGGAEAASYGKLQPPRLPRNGAFRSPREALMVYNLPRQRFLGEDHNQNALLDAEENDGRETFPPDNQDGFLDAGWSGLMTASSGITNVNVSGQLRVNIQSAEEDELAAIDGISSDLAEAIVGYRGEEEYESLGDLLDVRRVEEGDGPGGGGRGRQGRGGQDRGSRVTGNALISEDLLMQVADELTATDAGNRAGVVNINTAPSEVLACLPGIDRQQAEAIVSYRSSSGYFKNIAWLLDVPAIDQESFKEVASRISARSETFRILSEGKVGASGARERIEVTVQVRPGSVTTLFYREGL